MWDLHERFGKVIRDGFKREKMVMRIGYDIEMVTEDEKTLITEVMYVKVSTEIFVQFYQQSTSM